MRSVSSDSVVGRLNLEWERLRGDRSANAHAAAWAAENPRLAEVGSLAPLERANSEKINSRIDAMFHALVERAVRPAEDGPVAARVVLQFMLSKVMVIAGRFTRHRRQAEERRHLAVECMWEAIRTFPVERRRRYVPCRLA